MRLSDFGTPGAELSGVHYLRKVADADALLQGVDAAKAAGGKVGWLVLLVCLLLWVKKQQ